jgi:peptide/nickel transport system permease protein
MSAAASAVTASGRLWRSLAADKLTTAGGVLLAAIVLAAAAAPLLAPYDPLAQDLVARLSPPSPEHWLGTDTYGRDVLSRMLYGARISLFVGFFAIAIAMSVGSAIGMVAGYVGGIVDQVITALLDAMLAFPTLLLGLMIAAMLGASLQNLVIAIAVTEIAPFARIARGPTIMLKNREFVEAGRALGFGPARIIGVHILPNLLPDVVVMGSLWMAAAIRTEAALSFIGLGVPAPAASWGSMIREGLDNILDAWWLSVFPSVAILLTVFALNLLGDALRDKADPRMRTS